MSALWRHARQLLPRRSDYADLPRTFRGDLAAGVTVGVVALPLALGFAISSGLGPEVGLVTAIVAGFLAAVFGGSHVQVSGPTGAMVVVLAPIVLTHGAGAVALVSIMAGVIVLVAGAFHLGRAVSFIPWPVIEGFTLGIGVIIFVQQIPTVLGAAPDDPNVLVSAYHALAGTDLSTVLWGLGAVFAVTAAMIWLPRWHRSLPASLIGIVAVTVLAAVLPTPLAVIGELPGAVPTWRVPEFDLETMRALLLPAVAVAGLAGIESLLSMRVAATLGPTGRSDPDRELVGQGIASIGAGFFGGMPATGAIARTAVNLRAGGRTRLAAASHSMVLLLIVLVAAAPVGYVPLAALGGVLMVTATRMINVRAAAVILRSTRADAAAYVVTAVVTISVDLLVAVVIGIFFAGFFALRSLSRSTGVFREEIPGEQVDGDQRIALIRVRGPLFFAAADRVLATVLEVEDVSVVVLQMSQLGVVDATGANTLGEIVRQLEARGITVLIKGVRAGHTTLFHTVGVVRALRHRNHLFLDLEHALAHARSHVARERDA